MSGAGESDTAAAWQDVLFEALKEGDIRQVPYVPDAGHSHLIRRAHAEPSMKAYPLTTEEEGVAAAAGAWLGGERAALLMQSSGVGNCVNMLSLIANCRFSLSHRCDHAGRGGRAQSVAGADGAGHAGCA